MFKKIWAKLSAASEDDESRGVERDNLRNHERLAIGIPNIAKVVTAAGLHLPIVNISYGGFATSTLLPLPNPEQGYEDAHLVYLDQSVATRIKHIHVRRDVGGYCFEHRDAHALVFLRDVLEGLRYGGSLRQIKREFLKEIYQGEDWRCLRGEGPTDIVMRVDQSGRAIEFLCTVLASERYCELRLKDGNFSTGRTIDRDGVASRVASSPDLDEAIVRQVMQILAGIREEEVIRALAPVIDFGLSHLHVTPSSPAA